MYADIFSSSDSEHDEEPVRRIESRPLHLSSDEEDIKRIVKSGRNKRYEEMQSIIKNLNNHKKIKDMSNIIIDFQNLIKVYEKSVQMNDFDGVPPFYVRCMAELEDFINDSWEKKKEMNKGAVKSLATLKQRVKKYTRLFEADIRDFRENSENYVDEEPGISDTEVDEQETVPSPTKPSGILPTVKKSVRKSIGSDSEDDDDDMDDSDSDDFSDDDSSSTSSIDINLDRCKDPSVYFLKSTSDDKKDKTKIKKLAKDRPTKKQLRATSDLEDGTWTTIDSYGRPEIQVQAFEKGQEINFDVVVKKMTEILASRGKKGASTTDQILLLVQVEEKIKECHLSRGLLAKVLFVFISILFDYDKKHDCMTPSAFDRTLNAFDRLFDLLNEIHVELIPLESNEEESFEHEPYRIKASVLTVVGLLDVECFKVLQNANGHESEYVERLRDERRVCNIIDRLCAYLEMKEYPPDALCVAYLLKLEHMYYKFDFEWGRKVEASSIEEVGLHPNTLVIQKLCEFIYLNDRTDRLRTRAILCHIYHLALYNQWFKARDLMLMSNLQMSIEHADQSTMILYNRAMVQLGLCAFRQSHIRDAHNALADMIGSNRIRELLAQGLHTQARYEKTTEEEKREQALQMPYHMYINIDLIECVYLVSAMLLEIPNLAAHETDLRWRPISKPFHLALRVHDRAALVGPPETPRDHVLAAAKAMRYGNWKACTSFIINPKMDAKIWDLLFESNKVKQNLEVKIKEESLRSFLFTYSAIHDSMTLDRLSNCFELPKSAIYSVICKMIINQELAASLEVPSDALIMHKTERSRLQALALQLSDKVNSIVEMNDKLVESRSGGLSGLKGSQSYQGMRRHAFV
ncbi:Eukaryotic translation initiation factor 3 subunit C isoform 2 [Schistosoma japonicum]|uniref:Eukaryotic translation initiation factor 3 subunit C n=1 Tax=Schistosoma japonicum TaxID=6182 RepID=A0A4Z2D0L7_SCHJA|nr:Eukaryotic translation initiation factor 3 subunit C [Schistosoma japonicum]KAH8876747.1 Eukaryotic translation initiation factor 3 subunit C [Schistosoma japonicum]KAH8876750.1 Eukaryotic translation initiation factor 3 subunit C [Schistosoma japonicum]TNN10027.1 Eukaryotic translation initiation factor 3 subunit C isoform 2 [Schistosoma japonicum]